jgi:hypothetical protein
MIRRKLRTVVLTSLWVILASAGLPGTDSRSGPVAWWSFDSANGGRVVDRGSGARDELRGHYRLVPGVEGQALKFDGYTTCVVRKSDLAPRLSDEFTMEAWIALAAYPWNWCPVLCQEKDGLAGYSFGVGPQGEFGLRVSIRGEWQTCLAPDRLPLKKWAHIAATFAAGRGIKVFLDGKEVAARAAPGKAAYAESADLLIGMNAEKLKPSHVVGQGAGTIAGWYAFDGIMDEVRIFDRALSPLELQQAHDSRTPASPPDLPARTLPSCPPGPGRFGAYYTKLSYDEDWDALWPVGPAADIVVQFDDSPVWVVFWRGTRYSPAWVMDNGQWMADQSVETWDGGDGCYEHMQDPRCLYSQVRVLESGPARVVVHWRYAPVSSRNHLWRADEKTGWGLWVDEYYTFYPDQVAVRKVVWPTEFLGPESPSEIQETIPLCQPGQSVEDILAPDALTLLNLKGESHSYSWPGEWDDPERVTGLLPEGPNIQVVNLKSRAKPFIVFEPGCRMHVYVGRVRKGVAEFPAYNHWPISLMPSDGRYAVAADRVTSFSISYTDPPRHAGPGSTTWASWLYGTTAGLPGRLLALGRSWARAPELIVRRGNFLSRGYDISQRAYILDCKKPGQPDALECEVRAVEKSPLENLALVVRGWGDGDALLSVDGTTVENGRHLKIGHTRTLEGTDLLVWLKTESVRPVRLTLEAK